MGRPNLSQKEINRFINSKDGAWVTFTSIALNNNYSEPTLRIALKRLLDSGEIEVNTEARPYAYRSIV